MAQFWESSPIIGPGPVPGAAAPGQRRVYVPPPPAGEVTAAKTETPVETETPASEAEYVQFKLDPTRVWMKGSRGGFRNAGPRVGAEGDVPGGAEAKATQALSAAYYGRALRSHNLYGEGVTPLSLPRVLAINAAPIEARATMLSPDERAAYDYIDDFVRAKLRKESGAVIAPEEMRREYVSLFPQPGELPKDRERKRGIREQAIEGLRVAAGPAANQVRIAGGETLEGQQIIPSLGEPPPIAQMDLSGLGGPAEAAAVDMPTPGEDFETGDEADRAANLTFDEPPIGGTIKLTSGNDEPDTWKRINETDYQNERTGETVPNMFKPSGGSRAEALPPEDQARVNALIAKGGLPASIAMGGGDIISQGLLPRAGAALDAFTQAMGGKGSFEENYAKYLAMNRELMKGTQGAHPYGYFAGQALGGAALPIGRAATPLELGGVGAGYSAAHAAGSAETPAEAMATVPAAAALGFAGGAVGGKVSERLAARGVAKEAARAEAEAAEAVSRAREPTPQEVADALIAEKIPGSRPLVDPSKRGEMAVLETTKGGHKAIREGLEKTRHGIAAGADRLATGEPKLPVGMGGTIQGAGKRHLKELHDLATNEAGTGKYDLAAAEAGELAIPVDEAVGALDKHIATLARNPGTNKGSLAFLKRQRRNFFDKDGKPIPKTVADIRNIKSGIGSELRRKGLSMSPAEFVMNDVMKAAGRDVEAALKTAKPDALRLYQEGDALWSRMHTDREQFIEGLTGPKDKPFSGESAFAQVRNMMGSKGDSQTFDRIMDIMTPEERANFGATLMENIGRDAPDAPFSPAHFLSQTKAMEMPQLRRVFGDDAARSIMNLRVASRAYKSTYGALNLSRSGFVQNFQDILSSVLGPKGAVGGLIGYKLGGYPGAVAGALIGEGAKAAKAAFSARALMKPDVGRWANEAAKAQTKGQVMKAIEKLGAIGDRDASIRGEITALREYLIRTAKDNFMEPEPAAEPAQAAAQ